MQPNYFFVAACRCRARSQILKQEDSKDREKHVIKFIKIMKHLRKINNYNSYLALLSALDSAPIRRFVWFLEHCCERPLIANIFLYTDSNGTRRSPKDWKNIVRWSIPVLVFERIDKLWPKPIHRVFHTCKLQRHRVTIQQLSVIYLIHRLFAVVLCYKIWHSCTSEIPTIWIRVASISPNDGSSTISLWIWNVLRSGKPNESPTKLQFSNDGLHNFP